MAANNRKVLFIGRVHERGQALAESREDVDIDVYEGREPAEIRRRIADADAIVVRTAVIDRPVIDAGRRLAIISRHGVGFDAVDIESRGGAFDSRDHHSARQLRLGGRARHVHAARAREERPPERRRRCARTASSRRRSRYAGSTSRGRNLLIVGFGRIGSRVAPLALAFGMRVHTYDPYVEPGVMEAAGCAVVEDLHAVLPGMDAVTVHTPLNHETRGIIGAKELASMKPAAFVVNTARGGIVDENALLAALEEKRIGGAGIDVFDSEPTPPRTDHPLLAFDNVVVSPHCAGSTVESSIRMAEYSVRNVLDRFDGRLDPEVVVNGHLMPSPTGESA